MWPSARSAIACLAEQSTEQEMEVWAAQKSSDLSRLYVFEPINHLNISSPCIAITLPKPYTLTGMLTLSWPGWCALRYSVPSWWPGCFLSLPIPYSITHRGISVTVTPLLWVGEFLPQSDGIHLQLMPSSLFSKWSDSDFKSCLTMSAGGSPHTACILFYSFFLFSFSFFLLHSVLKQDLIKQ